MKTLALAALLALLAFGPLAAAHIQPYSAQDCDEFSADAEADGAAGELAHVHNNCIGVSTDPIRLAFLP